MGKHAKAIKDENDLRKKEKMKEVYQYDLLIGKINEDGTLSKVGDRGVFIHPWSKLVHFDGCKGITCKLQFDSNGSPETPWPEGSTEIRQMTAIKTTTKLNFFPVRIEIAKLGTYLVNKMAKVL